MPRSIDIDSNATMCSRVNVNLLGSAGQLPKKRAHKILIAMQQSE